MRSQPRRSLLLLALLTCAPAACAEGQGTLPVGGHVLGNPNGGSAAGGAGDVPRAAIPLAPDSQGWVSRTGNSLGLQGSWTTSAGLGSSVALTIQGTSLCLTGTTAQVVGPPYDFATYWGASGRLDLCRSSQSDVPPSTSYTLGSCPWSPGLASKVSGVRFKVSGTLPRELRVVFRERGRDPSAYVSATGEGTVVALFAEAVVPYNASAVPVVPAQVEAVELLAAPSWQEDWAFDFCIDGFEVLTGSGWTSLPDWVLEPGPGQQVELAGVNLSSAEWGQQNLPGTYGTDYIYPNSAEVDYYAGAGMNVIRLPFRWERLEQSLGGELDPTELERLRGLVDYAVGRGLRVILDPHNFARYGTGAAVVGVDFDVALFADFWRRLAGLFANDDRVIFGLMNEPHDIDLAVWLKATNAAIAAIRAAGAGNLILVPGVNWTGAWSWHSSGNENMIGVVDPGNRFVFEMHQYLDSDNSGSGTTCISETIGSARLAQATQWLRAGGYRGFLGEFGAPANETCLKAMDDLLAYVGTNSDVWLGWAIWAGGPWWREALLSVEPRADGRERAQMLVARRHLDAP
jgi:endoglucanase